MSVRWGIRARAKGGSRGRRAKRRRFTQRLRRKAWLYRGTFESARHACVLWSLMQSCRSLRVNPAKYLADVIEAMAVVPRSELHEWTPRAYAARAKR